jgi:dystonin
LEVCFQKWNTLWVNSNLYIERLKGVEMVVSGLEEATKFVSKVEIKLASYDNMPSDAEALKRVHEELVDLQSTIQLQQGVIDHLTEEVGSLRHLVEKSRTAVNATIRKHPDVDRLEAEVHTVVTRYSNICTQVVER